MRHGLQELTELLLIGCPIESIWIPRSKSNTWHQKPTRRHLNQRNFTGDEWNHLLNLLNISAMSVLQFVLLQWQNELNKNQDKNESQPNRDLWWIWQRGCQRSCRLQLHQTWGGPRMEFEILENLLQVTIDRGNLIDSPAGYSKFDYDRSWSSQEWKSEVTAHNRSGEPDETSWNAVQQICLHHGDALLDGNAHSVRYGEMIHDGSGQPDSATYQEQAKSETFVMASDAAEFVNKVKDQVRKRQKIMSNVADSGEEHSIISENVYGCDDECGDIHGKEFLNYSKFHQDFQRSHFEENVRHIFKIGGRTRRD